MLAAAGLSAADKTYYFPEVRIEIAVERDGAFVVDEYRTFEFQGEFPLPRSSPSPCGSNAGASGATSRSRTSP